MSMTKVSEADNNFHHFAVRKKAKCLLYFVIYAELRNLKFHRTMRAITCPQCGALIREVSESQTMTACIYCGAKVLIPRDDKHFREDGKQEKRISPNENINQSGGNTIWNSPFSDSNIYEKPKPAVSVAAAVTILFVGFFIIVAVAVGLSSKKKVEPALNLPKQTPFPMPTPPPMPVINIPKLPELNVSPEEDLPLFDVSYRVSWDSSIPEQHIQLPTLKDVDFPSDDLKTLQKTVFAQKIIRVRIKINTNGEVTDAKAVSGHQILKDAAENAARASYFAERKKPLDTTLVYHFQIKQIE